MDRRGAFRGGFGSYSFGSFGGSFDGRLSNGSLDRNWARSRFITCIKFLRQQFRQEQQYQASVANAFDGGNAIAYNPGGNLLYANQPGFILARINGAKHRLSCNDQLLSCARDQFISNMRMDANRRHRCYRRQSAGYGDGQQPSSEQQENVCRNYGHRRQQEHARQVAAAASGWHSSTGIAGADDTATCFVDAFGDESSFRSRGNAALGGRPGIISSRRVTTDVDKSWTPVTKLGRLVKDGKVKTIEEIYLHSMAIKEYQIVDQLLPHMRDEVLKIVPVQKVTRVGVRTRFKAFVAIGDRAGHVGLGVKCAKEVATAIRGAIYNAKTAVVPVTGIYDDVYMRLYPAPRGTGIVAPPVVRKILELGGIQDCYTSVNNPSTLGPLTKATFSAIQKTYWYVAPPPTVRNMIDSSTADAESYERKLQTQWQFLERKIILSN
ncbi:unnamed protein product [Anisakis simplex]|uniref:Small ribosomal subunit protein uS5 n=1 Tax=Anisakis simplex TaxID=6269 RepID=A0A0M3JTU5_ANISI|nr:unnamed protein product [Anisakis simplex]